MGTMTEPKQIEGRVKATWIATGPFSSGYGHSGPDRR